MRVHRLIAILMMVEKTDKIKAKELASKLEVSTRTIYRDIEALSEAGFPVYSTTGPDGGVSFTQGYTLGIDTEAVEYQSLLPNLIKQLQVIPDKATTAQSIESGFKQIQNLVSGNMNDHSPISSRLLIDEESWWGGDTDPFDIKVFIDVLWTLESIKITYQKPDNTSSIRTIDSYGLVLKHTNWYLIAYCHQSQALRTFRCERIIDFEHTKSFYQIPRNFNLKQHWEHSVARFSNFIKAGDDYLVTLEIPAEYINRFNKDEITWNSKTQNSYIATINMRSFNDAKSDILQMIGYSKVISPTELVDYTRSLLTRQLDLY